MSDTITSVPVKTFDEQVAEMAEIAALEENVSREWKLSDLIRLGANNPQKIGGWVDESKGETCALSTAVLAYKAVFGHLPGESK